MSASEWERLEVRMSKEVDRGDSLIDKLLLGYAEKDVFLSSRMASRE